MGGDYSPVPSCMRTPYHSDSTQRGRERHSHNHNWCWKDQTDHSPHTWCRTLSGSKTASPSRAMVCIRLAQVRRVSVFIWGKGGEAGQLGSDTDVRLGWLVVIGQGY